MTIRRKAAHDPAQFWWQVITAIVVLAYCVSLFVVKRPPDHYQSFWDGWVDNIASTLPCVLILLRIRRSAHHRGAWTAIFLGLALNTVGNLVYLFHDQNLHPIPSPALSDIFYLTSDAALIVGFAMMTQSSFGRKFASVRLDGLVAGLAVTSAAVMIWFDPILKVSGNRLQVVVGMAYPLSDVILLTLLVAGLAPHRYRPDWTVTLLMCGVLCNVVGDIIYLHQVVADTYVQGTPLDGTWVVGGWMMGLAAWPRAERRIRARQQELLAPGLATVPISFGALAAGLLGVSLFLRHSSIGSGLALAALVVLIGRMILTLREVRQGAENFIDARTDHLTGLRNRRAFLEESHAAMSALSEGEHVGVLLIDLDGFKEVNDSLGHSSGDKLLQIVGARFTHTMGDRGPMARLGGDEFAATCTVTTLDEMVAIAQSLGEALADPVALDGVAVRVGASIGVALSPGHGTNPSDLLRSADVAMYEAKAEQRMICVYQAEHDLNSRERLAMIDELRTAIETRSLILHYQPTLQLATNTVTGVEALVRWKHPTRGLLYPDAFIPLAERVGLIPQLTRAVLELAIAQAAKLRQRGNPLQMSVNISRFDLIDEDLPGFIDCLLDRYDVPHGQLTLEVTESCLSEDPQRAKRCIDELRARGVRISIDDFGVGYSSMSQLLELPVDELKIDKSFILALEHDDRAHAIISSTVELGKALDVKVVAEGVEVAANLATLRLIGANVAQGYHIARPLTMEQLDQYLELPAGEGADALLDQLAD